MSFRPEVTPLGAVRQRSTYKFKWEYNPLYQMPAVRDIVQPYVEGKFAKPPARPFVSYDEKWCDPPGNNLVAPGKYSIPVSMWKRAVDEYLSMFPDDLTC